jgi:hypothetical protein
MLAGARQPTPLTLLSDFRVSPSWVSRSKSHPVSGNEVLLTRSRGAIVMANRILALALHLTWILICGLPDQYQLSSERDCAEGIFIEGNKVLGFGIGETEPHFVS